MPVSPESERAEREGAPEEITDRQVEVLVHRVLAAVIAFLLAAAAAALLNSDDTTADDQQIERSGMPAAMPQDAT